MKYQFEKVRAIKKEQISPDDVICIEADANYSIIHLSSGKKIHLAKTLKQCHQMLENKPFIRPCRTFLVNMDYLNFLSQKELTLTNGLKAPISRRKRKLVETKYANINKSILQKLAGFIIFIFISISLSAQSIVLDPNVFKLPIVFNLTSILNPQPGMVVYHGTESSMYVYDSNQWQKVNYANEIPLPYFHSSSHNGTLLSVNNTQTNNINSRGISASILDLGSGISGTAINSAPTGFTFGVIGSNQSTNALGAGVGGYHFGGGTGVWGESYAAGTGVLGKSNSGTGVAAQSQSGYAMSATSDMGFGANIHSENNHGIYVTSFHKNAIEATSSKGIGLNVMSIDSTGIKASSFYGIGAHFESNLLAIKSMGPIQLGGTAMQAAVGKVLKSIDNNGLAQWQNMFPVLHSESNPAPLLDLRNFNLNSDQTRTIIAKNADEGVALEGIAEKVNPSTITVGVLGTNKSTGLGGYGVRGTHNGSGVGVYGSVIGDGTGVQGVANNVNATAGFFSSINGYGLKSNGKIAIYGGNTSPAAGKVLMSSNNNGDATWQPINQNPKTGFKAAMASQSIPSNTLVYLDIFSPEFEDGGGVNSLSNTYTINESGVYHVQINLAWDQTAVGETILQIRKNATVVYESVYNPQLKFQTNELTNILKLQSGDIIEFCVYQYSGAPKTITNSNYKNQVSVVRIY